MRGWRERLSGWGMIGGVLSLHDFKNMRKLVAFSSSFLIWRCCWSSNVFHKRVLFFPLVFETLSVSNYLVLWTTLTLFRGRWPDKFSRGCAPLSRLANYYPERFHALIFVSVSYTEPGIVRDIGM